MKFHILTVLIFSLSTSAIAAKVLCSRLPTTWEQGVNNCLEDRGTLVNAQNVWEVALKENLNVWTSNYFVENNRYSDGLRKICGFSYLSYDSRQPEIFFSNCYYSRRLFCSTFSGNWVVVNGTWYDADECWSWGYLMQYRVSQPGYYWSRETIQGKQGHGVPTQRIDTILCGAYNTETSLYFRNCNNTLTSLCQFGTSMTASKHFKECGIDVHHLGNGNNKETTTNSENIVHQLNFSTTSKIPLYHTYTSTPKSPVDQEENVSITSTFSTDGITTHRLSASFLTDQSESTASIDSTALSHLQDTQTTQATMQLNNPFPENSEEIETAGTAESHLKTPTLQHGGKPADVSIIAGVAVAASLLVVAIITGLVFVQRRYGCIPMGKKDRTISSMEQTRSLQEKNSFGASKAHANLAYVTTDVLRISTSELDICTNAVMKKPDPMVPSMYKISPFKATNLSTESHYGSNVSNNYSSPDTIKHSAITNPGNGQPCEYSFAVEEPPAKEQPGMRAANTKQDDEYDTCAARKMVYPGENIYDTTGAPDCRQDVYNSACQKKKMQKTQALESEYGIAKTNSLNEDHDYMSLKNDLNGATENVYNRLY